MSGKKCQNCGVDMGWYRRVDKKFCGQNCRKAWSRRAEKVAKERAVIMSSLGQIRAMAKEYPDLRSMMVDDLKYLRQEMTDILRMYDGQEMREQAERAEIISGFRQGRS